MVPWMLVAEHRKFRVDTGPVPWKAQKTLPWEDWTYKTLLP